MNETDKIKPELNDIHTEHQGENFSISPMLASPSPSQFDS
jgi:hypothetical protein